MQRARISRKVENLTRALRAGLARDLYAFPGLAILAPGPPRPLQRETGQREAADIVHQLADDPDAARARLAARGIGPAKGPHGIHVHPDKTEEWMAVLVDDEARDPASDSLRPPCVRRISPPSRSPALSVALDSSAPFLY